MKTKLFLALVGAAGIAIGSIALLFPAILLGAKAVPASPGALIVATSVVAAMVRHHSPSPTLRIVFVGGILTHGLLFPIELLAWHQGTIPRLASIVPNSLFHLVAMAGFVLLALRRVAPAK